MKRKQTTRVENLKNDLVNLRLSKRMINLKIKETKKRIRAEKINQRFESKKGEASAIQKQYYALARQQAKRGPIEHRIAFSVR